MINWNELSTLSNLEKAVEQSFTHPIVIFKHSTRCPISQMALDRFERKWDASIADGFETYFLDLIAHREISNMIASQMEVQHESPQVLVIRDGKCVYSETHQAIRVEDVLSSIKN